MKTLAFHPDAKAELREAVEFYEGRRAGLGREFRINIEQALERISNAPRRNAFYKQTPIRFCLIRRFPYAVYFAEQPNRIWIVAIAHGSKRPGYWRYRMS